MLEPWIDQAWEAAPQRAAMDWLAGVAAHDRYQASHGILQAAALVAEVARDIGMQEVSLHRFPADGHHAFWGFRSPLAWTPIRARLLVQAPGTPLLALDHAEQAMLVATHSAPTPAGGVWAPLVPSSAGDWRGAVVWLEGGESAHAQTVHHLQARGALGFIQGATGQRDGAPGAFSGRVELPGDTGLFGFSVTPSQGAAIAQAAHRGAQVHADLQIGRDAPMPAVTAVLTGTPEPSPALEEVWLTAHLCHPRPGANDNASGAAALLGCAAALRRLQDQPEWSRRRRTVRFVWAPEFVGTAAVLCQHVGAHPWPCAVLNLDMVGEDQRRCGGPFVVERSPDVIASPLTAVAEAVVAQVFQRHGTAADRWRSSPFLGYSDHALFAGPHHAVPAVQFSHWPDRFNHSGADTLDKVSPQELRRTMTASCVLAHLAANDWRPLGPTLPALLNSWCLGEAAALHAQGAQLPQTHQAWGQRRTRHLLTQYRRLVDAQTASVPVLPRSWTARWEGPLNLRAMLAQLPNAQRASLEQKIRADKQVLALLSNMAIRADGRRTAQHIVDHASFALGRPLRPALAHELFRALTDSGWIAPHTACP